MIGCSAFCLTLDDRDGSKAAERAARIDRNKRRVRPEKVPLGKNAEGRLVALELDPGEGLPVVHGWLGENSSAGEYSMITEGSEGTFACRDELGTRPLIRAASGRWVASDHRFFPDEPSELLPAGSKVLLGNGVRAPKRNGRKEFEGSFEEACESLSRLIDGSVRERVQGRRRVAVGFSGGLDSSILAYCAARYTKVVACSAAAPGSVDSRVAGEAAKAMGLESVSTILKETEVLDELRRLELPFEPSPMDRGLWCIYSMVSRLAAEAGADLILLGQLADELFGGYAKYEQALGNGGKRDVERMMIDDVTGCGMRGFIRDEAACSRWLEPRFPFADQRVAELGFSVPVDFKIKRGVRKAVLRGAALKLGLAEEVASTPKKAAQYSSGILKVLG